MSASFPKEQATMYDESKWGGWRREGVFDIYYDITPPRAYPPSSYVVDLRRFTSSAKMLDVIMQVARKTWASAECIAGLVRALDHIFQVQGVLCSCGVDERLTQDQVIQICRDTFNRQHP
jgi:hypothetical protein